MARWWFSWFLPALSVNSTLPNSTTWFENEIEMGLTIVCFGKTHDNPDTELSRLCVSFSVRSTYITLLFSPFPWISLVSYIRFVVWILVWLAEYIFGHLILTVHLLNASSRIKCYVILGEEIKSMVYMSFRLYHTVSGSSHLKTPGLQWCLQRCAKVPRRFTCDVSNFLQWEYVLTMYVCRLLRKNKFSTPRQ